MQHNMTFAGQRGNKSSQVLPILALSFFLALPLVLLPQAPASRSNNLRRTLLLIGLSFFCSWFLICPLSAGCFLARFSGSIEPGFKHHRDKEHITSPHTPRTAKTHCVPKLGKPCSFVVRVGRRNRHGREGLGPAKRCVLLHHSLVFSRLFSGKQRVTGGRTKVR